MPRSIWKGSISFGLVHVPVDLFVAEDPQDLAFVQLDKRNFARVGYERINKSNGKKVDWTDIVKGYEHADGEYVVLTEAELAEAYPKATHTIDIEGFVDASEIHPMYFDKPYYVVPGKGGEKPYALLVATLERTGRAGIARVVLRTREHLAALTTRDHALVLVTMRFAHELRSIPADTRASGKSAVSDRELSLAEKLVDGMMEAWQPEHYKDEYRDDVMALVDKKVKAGAVNALPEHTGKKRLPRSTQPVDLMALLEESLGEHAPKAK